VGTCLQRSTLQLSPCFVMSACLFVEYLRCFISPFLSTSFLDFSSSRLCFLLPMYLFIYSSFISIFSLSSVLSLFLFFFLRSFIFYSHIFILFPVHSHASFAFVFLTSLQSSYLQNTSSSSKFVLLLRIYALETFDLLFSIEKVFPRSCPAPFNCRQMT
jgi:hypothetical protein